MTSTTTVEEEQIRMEEPTSYDTLFRLSNDVGSAILPKFDYIINAMKGGNASDTKNTHFVDASDFYGSIDPDVMRADDPKKLDDDKLTVLKQQYRCSSHGASALQGDERLAACLLYFPELTEFAPGGRA